MADSPTSGDLRSEPLPMLFRRALRERLTGRIVLQGESGRAVLYFRDGMAAAVQAPECRYRLGDAVHDLGLVDRQVVDRILQTPHPSGRRVGELLIEHGSLDPAGVAKGLRLQLLRNACRLFTRRADSFSFEAGEHERGLDAVGRAARVDPRRIVYYGLRSTYDEGALRALLGPVAGKAVRLRAEAAPLLEAFGFEADDRQAAELLAKGYWALDDLTAGCDGGAVSALRAAAAPFAFDLLEAQPVDAVPRLRRKTRTTQAMATATTPPATPAVDAPPTLTKIPLAPEGAEGAIHAKAQAAEAQGHYEALESARTASKEDLKLAYLRLARSYHPDRAQALGAPELRSDLEKLFARLSEAYAVLSDDVQRREYDQRLAGGGGGAAPRGEGSEERKARLALEAELAFQKGDVLLKRRDFAGALQHLREAVEKNPEEGEHLALLAWAEYTRPGADAGALARQTLDRLQRAAALSPKCARAHHYLGMVLKTSGDPLAAERAFRRALELQPRNVEVERELRLLEMRRGGGTRRSEAGFFDRFRRK